ncbi:MAG TPA: PKD domain-containing protein, partial [Gemmataceae bacterium]|nr:PKD domain-containing protein [Gemmataceae bacterium]
MTPTSSNARRRSNFHTRRQCRPYLERLEDRLAPTTGIQPGDVLVASSANALNGFPSPTTATGLIAVDHTNFGSPPSGNESAIAGDRTGFMAMPEYIVPDTLPNTPSDQGFYVADHTAFGRGEGAILQVSPPTPTVPDNETAVATMATYSVQPDRTRDTENAVPTLTAPAAMVLIPTYVGGNTQSKGMLFVASSGSDNFPNSTGGIIQSTETKLLNGTPIQITVNESANPSDRNPNIVMVDPSNPSQKYHGESDPITMAGGLNQQVVVYPDPVADPFPLPNQPSQDALVDPIGMAVSPQFQDNNGAPTDLFVLDGGAGGTGEVLDFTLPTPGSANSTLGGPYVVTAALTSPVDMAYDPYTGNLDVVEAASGGTVVSVTLTGSSGSVNGSVHSIPGPTGPIANLGSGVAGIAVNPPTGTVPGTIYVDTAETATAPAQVWQLQPSPNGQNGVTYTPSVLPMPAQVLSAAKGMYCNGSTLYIATSPSPHLTFSEAQALSLAAQKRDTSTFPTGIVTYSLASGNLDTATLTREPGLFSLPQGLAEDQQQNIYVADETALGAGAIIHVDPRNGSASLLAWGNDLDGPVGVAFNNFNQSLDVINAGDSSFFTHSLVQVSLNGSSQFYLSTNQQNTISVLSGIAFDSSNDVLYVLDQGGNVINTGTKGQVWEDLTPGSVNPMLMKFGHAFPAANGMDANPEQAQPDAIAVDSDNGKVFACTEGIGGDTGAVVLVPPSEPLQTLVINSNNTLPAGNLVGTDGIAVGMGPFSGPDMTGITSNTIFVDCLNPISPISPSLTAFPELPSDWPKADSQGDPAQQRVSTGSNSGASLGLVTGCLVYDPPLPVNAVNFETGDFSQVATQTNAAIVSSPVLDGKYSLQLQRSNSVANAEIRGNGTTYYNLPTASYSFEFGYTSNSGDNAVVNFNGTASGYKAALHLNSSGQLGFYDSYGRLLATGSTVLQPNWIYTISAVIGTGGNAPWVVSINGNVEMSGTGNLGTNNNGALELGGNGYYTSTSYYDDVQISAIGVGGPPMVEPGSGQTVNEGVAHTFAVGSFSDMGPGPWTATVNWGDGTSTTLPAPSAPGSLATPSHTYSEEGTYTVTVMVTDTGDNATGSVTFTISVLDLAVTATPATVSPTAGAPFSGPVATFTDPGGAEPNDGTHYSATINWGDNTATSTGSITFSSGVFTVNGTHTYAQTTTYTITATISHGGLTAPVQIQTTVANLGQFVPAGMVKPIGFWEGLQGQELIRQFGVTSTNQTLGQWLATTLPNLYGGAGGAANLSSFTNAQIGTYYQSLFLHPQGGNRLDAEVL